MKLIVPVGASTVACALRKPETSPRFSASSHDLRAAPSRSVGTESGVLDVPDRGAVLRDHADHRAGVALVARERAHARGDLGRLAVGAARHERRDRGGVGAALVRVVREPARHQQRAEVRVAEAELAVRLRVPLDLGRRVARVADEISCARKDLSTACSSASTSSSPSSRAELHQVERGQVARRVVDAHVLGARVRRVDAARVRARVPRVDRRVVLDARIGARQAASAACVRRSRAGIVFTTCPVGAGREVPVGALLGRLHELRR